MHVNTREIAAEYRLAHWAKIMQERSESGMSIKAFCEAEGFRENIYYYWQRKLREASCTDMTVTNNAVAPQGWAVCKEADASVGEKALPIEIGGCRIMVGSDVDSQLLAKVCRVLVSL